MATKANSHLEGDFSGKRIYRIPYVQSYAIREFFKQPDLSQKEDPLFPTIAAKDGKTLPALHDLNGGMYLVYENVASDEKLPIDGNLDLGELERAKEQEEFFVKTFGKAENFTDRVEFITQVPTNEFVWMTQYDDAIATGTTPPEPPKEIEHLFSENVFRAHGKSFDALEHLLQQEMWRHKAQENLEKRLFGAPKVKDTFNVGGHGFVTLETKLHPVFNDGKAIGIRCDWTPLHPNYTGMKNVEPPEGWHELSDHPGVFAPDPATNPQDAAALEKLSYPDYKSQEDVFGDAPIVTVTRHKDGYPRTYQNWPSVDALKDQAGPLYYITVPVDYKNDVFHPTDAIRVTKYEIARFRHSTGDMYEPHMYFRPVGVAYPEDFKYTPPKAESDIRYFRLAGRSAQILKDYEAEKEKISNMRRDFVKAAGGTGTYGSLGNKITWLEFDNHVPQGWTSIRESKRGITDRDGNYQTVTSFECKPNMLTKEGRELAKQMKSFPPEPGIQDLQKRWTPDAPHMPFPRWDNYEGGEKIAYYDISEIAGEFVPPPGAIELPTAAYQWYSRNKSDIQSGIKTPPMPEALKKQVEELVQDKKRNTPAPPSDPQP